MHVLRTACVFSVALLSACSVNKSENPLSPTLAGPIAGVTISAPKPVLPAPGARIARDAHPVALVIENASTTGQRPMTYTYEVSTDAGFSTSLLQRTGVTPGDGGRTSVELPGPLEPGRTYYWRVHALDGANTGPHSDVAHFTVFEAFVLAAPTLLSPVGGALVNATQPVLRIANATRSGEAETVSYEFQVSPNTGFNPLDAFGTVGEQANETTFTTTPLQASRTYYWRVRAVSRSTSSPWSSIAEFRTPASITPAPPPGGGLPPSNPGPRPSVSEGVAMVAAVIADMRTRGIAMSGDCGAFAITRRVAWAFRNRGAGLERKTGGRNCDGHSIDIVLFTDGQSVDILIGAGDDNGPAWQEHGVLSDWPTWWIAPSNPD